MNNKICYGGPYCEEDKRCFCGEEDAVEVKDKKLVFLRETLEYKEGDVIITDKQGFIRRRDGTYLYPERLYQWMSEGRVRVCS